MSRAPRVSWLLCSHAADDALRGAISSCLDQTFSDFELLVIANGPQHEVVDAGVTSWFGQEARLRVIATEVRHLTFSLNLGLHHARAELIARMDGDDVAYRQRLRTQLEFMRAHPQVSVLGSAYDVIDANGHILHRVSPPRSDREIRRALLRGNPICHPSVMFKRRVVLDAGGYLGGVHAQDYDLWSRLALDPSVQFANLDEPLIAYRAVPTGHARYARSAYAAVAASQWRNFAAGAGVAWAGAALWTMAKAAVRAVPSR